MISDKVMNKIRNLIGRYPKKESVLMPALMLVQKDNENFLSEDDISAVAKTIGVAESEAYGVATFYTMYNLTKPGKFQLQVDTNIPATLAGAIKILNYLEDKLGIKAGETTKDNQFSLREVEDLGSCGACPVIQVNDVYYENMTEEKVDWLLDSLKRGVMPEQEKSYNYSSACNILLKNRGVENSTSIKTYKKNGGYKALEKAKEMKPNDIVSEVKKSMLRGRGGAGFPTGVKWSFVPKDVGRPSYLANPGKPVYLVCNADEGEPGTFKDRQIMEYDPHLLIEGMIISGLALNSKLGFIYIRGEFDWIADILETAVEEARADGQLQNFDIIVHRGGGAYVCGEETALIESLEGKRGCPRLKPPFPAVEGLYGCPTVVNNVETLATIPFIIEKGAEEFKKFGQKNNHGFKIFGISGNVNKPGTYEYPLGTPLNELLEAAGGVKGTMKAVIVGGLSVPILRAEELNHGSVFKNSNDAGIGVNENNMGLLMDYDSCIKHGTALGSGGIMVINEEFSIPELALRTIKFYAHESCGKCVPCREGSDTIKKLLQKIVDGRGRTADLDFILKICKTVKGVSICPTAEAFSVSISSMITKFRDEFDELLLKE